MKNLLFIGFVFIQTLLYAQESQLELDVLRAPISPASNLLGISTTDIDKPTDVSSLMLSIQSATNSFSKLPSNYALDFSPFYLSGKSNINFTTKGLENNAFSDVFKQTFVISTAISNPDSSKKTLNPNSTYGAIGFKFSIFRGKYSLKTKDKLQEIGDLQKNIDLITTENAEEWLKQNDEEYKKLLKKREGLFQGITDSDKEKLKEIINSDKYKEITENLSVKLENFNNSRKKEEQQKIKDDIKVIASNFQLERIGFSWDVNGGMSTEFRNRNFNDSKIHNVGIWSNFGYTLEDGIAFLGLVRYLYNPDKIFALDNNINDIGNISTIDAGGKISYSKPQSKFNFSAEAIYRSVLSNYNIAPTWKILFNADYSIFNNQKLTFSFGKDFDGTITKNGNLIAALTFVQGFGNKR